jgi:D-proline reductase (dithiol) PrdB
MATVCIMNLRKVAERIQPPRTLLVHRPMGTPLGDPGDQAGQRALLEAALGLLVDPSVAPGTIREYEAAGD